MNKKLEVSVIRSFELFHTFWAKKQFYSALSYLSNIYNCLNKLSPQFRKHFYESLSIIEINEEILKQVKSGINKDIERLNRLLDADNLFIYEEFVLLFTIRTEVELVIDFLNEKLKVNINFNNELSYIDSILKKISKHKNNQKASSAALSSIKKWGGMPIDTTWTRF